MVKHRKTCNVKKRVAGFAVIDYQVKTNSEAAENCLFFLTQLFMVANSDNSVGVSDTEI